MCVDDADDVDDVLDVCWDNNECFFGGKMPAKSTTLAWVL